MAEAESPHFKWLTPILADEANVPAHLLRLAKEIDEDLHNLSVSELGTAGAGDAKKLLIVQNTGAAAWKAMSGDATIAESGAVTISAAAVTATKLAASAVTRPKINPGTLKTERIALGEFAAGEGRSVTHEYAEAFLNANYTLVASLRTAEESVTGGAISLVVKKKTSTSVVFEVFNNTGKTLNLSIDLIAVHDTA